MWHGDFEILSSGFPPSYFQQRWTKAACQGPWGASLALGPGTKPVLDVADFREGSALACLSAGCCLSPLCTVQEEVHPLVDWVCLSVKSDSQKDRKKTFWNLCVELVFGVCMFWSCILSLLSLRWWITYQAARTSRGNHYDKHPIAPGFSLKLKTLTLHLFLNLYSKHEVFIFWHIGKYKSICHSVISLLSANPVNSIWILVCAWYVECVHL